MTHKIHTLWCHPRSVSTAFERIMRERGDCHAFHEPFMYHYYLGKLGKVYAGFDPDPSHPRTFADIRAMILEQAAQSPVFLKDMGYYVLPEILDDVTFLDRMTHAILVRDPAESIVSYAKVTADFSSQEVGFRSLWQLYEGLTARGHNVHVICADKLRAAPAETLGEYWAFAGLSAMPHALRWDASVPKGWETVSTWHAKTLQSGGIQKPRTSDAQPALVALGPPFTDYYAAHKPYYDRLLAQVAR